MNIKIKNKGNKGRSAIGRRTRKWNAPLFSSELINFFLCLSFRAS